MFDRSMYHEHDVLPLARYSGKQEKKYQNQLKELDDAINLEREKLGQWLINWENKKALHYKLVEDIHNYFYQEDSDINNQPLNFRENRLADLLAVNNAIYKNNERDLRARSIVNMKNRSLRHQIAGILMGCLAVALVVVAFCAMEPFLIPIAIIMGVSGLGFYKHGTYKVHTQKSTLFARLHDHFLPTASAPKPVRNEASLHVRHML